MKPSISHALPVLLMVAAAPGETAGIDVPDDASGIFLEAIEHLSNSGNDAAMVAIVDPETGQETSACVEVDVLGRALALEQDIAWTPSEMPRIIASMRDHEDRRFVFHHAEALAVLGKDRDYPNSMRNCAA